MRLSLTQLETARSDPRAMATTLRSGTKSRLRFSRAQALYLSARKFHKQNDNLTAARDYLIAVYRRNFLQPKEMLKLLNELDLYAGAYQATGNTITNLGARISITIDSDFQLTGEIPRIDIVPSGGYAIWLFSRSDRQWKDELRMPIIQYYFAQTFGVDISSVSVGFYFFTAARYDSNRYSQAKIDNARRECRSLGAILRA